MQKSVINKGSAGGKARALLQKEEARIARLKYKFNPNRCLNCGAAIELKDWQTLRDCKLKKFCSHSCAAKRHKRKLKFIEAAPEDPWLNKTKETLLNEAIHYTVARNRIRSHATKLFQRSDKPKCCLICGYSRHINVCHIRAVKDFSDTTSIAKINHIDNLIALCPTHHWEYDHGYVTLKERDSVKVAS